MLTLFALAALASERRTPVVQAVELARPAVVTIDTEVQTASPFPFFYEQQRGTSEGSGVIIDASGLVLTNAHVVEGALSITVHTDDGRTWTGSLLALEPDLDLAVLKLENARELPVVKLGNSDTLLLGEPTIAIGNPYGLGLTVSTGIVSSLSREVQIEPGLYQNYIQTDAAINPGNSGGALVNIDGELIGINTFIHAGAEGIGFAIPVNRAKKIADDLVKFGAVRLPWLGCDFRDVSPRRLAGTALEKGAILVERVYPGGPAEKAGLRPGDLLWDANGRAIASRADLNAFLADKQPGTAITVSYVREHEAHKAKVTGGELPADIAETSLKAVLGIAVAVGPTPGLVVAEMAPAGSWARAGLRAGDVILAVDGQPIRTADDLRAVITRAKARHRSTALFTVMRGRYRGNVSVGV